jgi:hypothetical protein
MIDESSLIPIKLPIYVKWEKCWVINFKVWKEFFEFSFFDPFRTYWKIIKFSIFLNSIEIFSAWYELSRIMVDDLTIFNSLSGKKGIHLYIGKSFFAFCNFLDVNLREKEFLSRGFKHFVKFSIHFQSLVILRNIWWIRFTEINNDIIIVGQFNFRKAL